MNADRDPLAYAGAQENQDAEILTLFHQWLDVCRVLDANAEHDKGSDAETRWNAATDRQGDIEDRIFECRGGSIGMAVKVFLDIYRDVANWTPSNAQLRFAGDEDRPVAWFASMLRDAASLVPEIGECAAAVLHDDAVLIDADMQVQWASWAIGEPLGRQEGPEHRAKVRKKLQRALDCISNTPAKTPRGEAIKAKHKAAGGSAP